MTILLLGGAGAMAEIIARDLLECNIDHLILADRDIGLLQQRAKKLQSSRKKTRLELRIMDIKSPHLAEQLKKTKADVLINATWYMLNTVVMDAAIKARMNYLDLGGLYWKTKEQLKQKKKAKAAGTMCLLGMGETPGAMNVLAKYGGMLLDRIERVDMRCGAVVVEKVKNQQWFPPYAIQTLMDEVTKQPAVLRNGKIVFPQPLAEYIQFDLSKPIGKSIGYYTLHSELATLPAYFKNKGVKTMDFAYAYDQQTLDVITALDKVQMTSKTPIKVNDVSVSPYQFLGLVDKYLIPRPKRDVCDVESIRTVLYGTRKGKKMRVTIDLVAKYHKRWQKSAGSVATGVPASIVAQWIASGKLHTSGVWTPEDVIDPFPFFKELSKQGRGMAVYLQIGNGARRKLIVN
ncbi:saccharopine dehydrogenase NADP-binding domain-containing protein [Candidatus Woesearchaeota archaeon]|nr:saccharopine dehydrogenase NADP-binding domain-containing protein [Candidatus Woesearchaeota archaeon]